MRSRDKLVNGENTIMQQSNRYRTFEELYEDNKLLVFYFINKRVDRDQDIEDLSSQVWERAHVHAKKLLRMEKPPVRQYLQMIEISVVEDDRRRAIREKKVMVYCDPADLEYVSREISDSVEDILFKEDIVTYIKATLAELNETERQLLWMYRKKKLSSKEIAEILGVSEVTVRVKVHRLKNKMEDIYDRIMKKGEGYFDGKK